MRLARGLVLSVVVCALAPAAYAGPKGKRGGAAKAAARRGAAAPVVKLKPAEVPADAAPKDTGSAPVTRGPTRIDFDDRLIQGQTNKSGAVYLYDRKELKTRSMVKRRESFRDEIVATIYDD